MDKIAAIQTFLNTFLPAYEENSIFSAPVKPSYPYITYEGIEDSFTETDTAMTFSTWYREYSWNAAVTKTKQISALLGREGKMLQCDDGYVLIMRGSPFSQRMGDESDDLIKRTFFNLTVRFYTND